MASSDGVEGGTPHVVLVPLMAPSHMIPMVGMAKLLASRGAVVSLVTTPSNAAWMEGTIQRCAGSGLAVQVIVLRFPSREVGLPEGCERLDMIPSKSMTRNFLRASEMMQEPLERRLRESRIAPSFIISDAGAAWTRALARALGVPRLVFHGYGCFALLCQHNLHVQKTHLSATSESDPFVVPGLPQRVEVTRAQLPGHLAPPEGELSADGFVVNTFVELEPSYVSALEETTGKKVWTIGPLSLCDRESPGSVVYASFGSLARLPPSQLVEVGLGLEASGQPFIWAIKTRGEEASREGIPDPGMGAAGGDPVTPAVGGFLTHCGWNSTLESVCAGVPMAAWPLFSEQFLNERLVVEILGIAVAIGVKSPTIWGEVEKAGVQVTREEVARALVSLTDVGKEAKARRRRARNLAKAARRAVEDGGSSLTNLDLLLRTVTQEMSPKNAVVVK
ncbi:unnamed protein product [Spirodela intermedia]|uniref:Uncharacterized protein n=1 Tax=Spirodela intermedia TaxID=51605 RepID=A0A7I8J8E8_SPIIN|nr:unnamed protein product [Spirodela intermedia]CAA6666344.1 unnamed protein product [Spirodela intermedia]